MLKEMRKRVVGVAVILAATLIPSLTSAASEELIETPEVKKEKTIESTLSLSFQNELTKLIDELKTKNNFNPKMSIITLTTVSNGAKLIPQVESFLASKGIKVQAYGKISMALNGFKVQQNQTCLEVVIGII